MTRVCLVGDDDVNLQYELLSRETAREALATYDLTEPFENAVGVETVSLGAAVALLNDLDWYLVRFVEESMVLEPSVSDEEWLSRDLATAIRDDEVAAEASARFLKIYGLESTAESGDSESASSDGTARASAGGTGGESERGMDGESDSGADGDTVGRTPGDATASTNGDSRDGTAETYRLVEPMYVTRTGADVPTYDLRDVEETLVQRVTESEFGA